MALEMVYYPDPRLTQKSKPVQEVTKELRALVPQMFEAMYRHRGIGLAGPQAGMMQRIIVANLTGSAEHAEEEHVFINPEILSRSGTMTEDEGCLSLPGISARIKRSAELKVRYFDLEGQGWTMECDGLWAKLFQHEIDHLDGILMLERMTAADLKQWKPLLKEMEEDFKAGRAPSRRRDRATAAPRSSDPTA